MPKYTDEFRQQAVAHMKKVGVTQTCKDLKIARCTLYQWCHKQEGMPADTDSEEESVPIEAPALPETEESAQAPAGEQEEDPPTPADTIATAMSMLVIENMELRATIRQLRSTISGLTDRIL